MKRFLLVCAPSAGGIAHTVYALADTPENAQAYARGLTGNDIILMCNEIPAPEPVIPPAPEPAKS